MKVGQLFRRRHSAAETPAPWRRLSAVLLISVALQTVPASAAPKPSPAPVLEVLNDASFYPEGAHVQDGGLYYAEMPQHRVMRWQEGENQVVWERWACGPTSIAPRAGGKFLIACHFAHQVVETNMAADKSPIVIGSAETPISMNGLWPVTRPNDMSSDDKGGTYISSSGEFSKRVPKTGKVMYLSKAGEMKTVASDIWYANGVYHSRADGTLYVSEHLGGRVLAYPVESNGDLAAPRVHIEISDYVDTEAPGIYYVGPDGLTQDSDGNLYVCIYGAGEILVFAPDGTLSARLSVPDQYVTNVDLSADEQTLYITAPTENSGSNLSGKVYRVANPLKP